MKREQGLTAAGYKDIRAGQGWGGGVGGYKYVRDMMRGDAMRRGGGKQVSVTAPKEIQIPCRVEMDDGDDDAMRDGGDVKIRTKERKRHKMDGCGGGSGAVRGAGGWW